METMLLWWCLLGFEAVGAAPAPAVEQQEVSEPQQLLVVEHMQQLDAVHLMVDFDQWEALPENHQSRSETL